MAGDSAASGASEGGKKADDDVVVLAGAGGDGSGVGKRMTRLPEEEVKWVLSRKGHYLSSTSKKLVSPEVTATSKDMGDNFMEYQEWMRNEFEANNCVVMVDDEFLAQKAETNRLKEELATMFYDSVDFTAWAFSDCPSDFFKDEDEGDDEDVDEDDEEEPESN